MTKARLIALFAAGFCMGPLASKMMPEPLPPEIGRPPPLPLQDQARIALFASNQADARAALVIRDSVPVLKRYAPGYSDKTRFVSWSMAKSVTAVLIGELVADGTLKLDAPVPFAEWHKPGDPRAQITLRHMLHMSSGLEHVEDYALDDGGGTPKRSDTTSTLFVDGTHAMAARGLAKALKTKPGTTYDYNSLTTLLLSELITRQLTDSGDPRVRARAYKTFAEDRLFKPAGITSAFLEFDGAGTQIGGSLIYMTLDDWGRFGQVLLDGKGTSRAPILTPDWLTFLTAPSPANPEYGGHVWLNRKNVGEDAGDPALFPGQGPDSVYAAVGHLGQYVIVSPEQKLVLVRLGKTNDADLGPVRAALGQVIAKITTEGKR